MRPAHECTACYWLQSAAVVAFLVCVLVELGVIPWEAVHGVTGGRTDKICSIRDLNFANWDRYAGKPSSHAVSFGNNILLTGAGIHRMIASRILICGTAAATASSPANTKMSLKSSLSSSHSAKVSSQHPRATASLTISA